MKIAFCHYKTPKPVIDEFLKKWPMYEYVPIETTVDDTGVSDVDYPEHLRDSLRKLTGKLCDKMQGNFEKTFVVYDNTMLNILADTLLSVDGGFIKNTDFITTQFLITQNMFAFVDIIFWLVDESETEDAWELSTRNIFKQFNKDSWDQSGLIFPLKDRPAFIEVPYNPKNPKSVNRVIADFLDNDGKVFDPESADFQKQLSEMSKTVSEEDIKKFFNAG